jgi:hypothetical protein
VRYDGLEYEKYAAGRTQWLQQVIRHASGDLRLMNPITSVESHPGCPRNELVRTGVGSWRRAELDVKLCVSQHQRVLQNLCIAAVVASCMCLHCCLP